MNILALGAAGLAKAAGSPIIASLHACLIVLAIFLVCCWLRARRARLESIYRLYARLYSDALAETERAWQQLKDDSLHLVFGSPPFEGLTKVAHDKARANWSAWLAQRNRLARLLEESQALEHQHRARRWWQTSLEPLQQAVNKLKADTVDIEASALAGSCFEPLVTCLSPSTVESIKLPALVLAGAQAAIAETDMLAGAIKLAAQADCEMKEEIQGSRPESDSLSSHIRQLEADGLPLDPYQASIAEVDGLSEAFSRAVSVDPVNTNDYRITQTTLIAKVRQLKSTLHAADGLMKEFVAAKDRVETATALVSDKRSQPVEVGIPDLEFAAAYTLSEPGSSPDERLEEARSAIERLEQLLKSAQLAEFTELKPVATSAAAAAIAIVESALADKNSVDTDLSAVTGECTPADLEADREHRDEIARLYREQSWHEARQAVAVLKSAHEERKSARACVTRLVALLDGARAERDTVADVVSGEVDGALAVLAGAVAGLSLEASRGSADWASITCSAGEITDKLSSSSDDSLLRRLRIEVERHRQAMTAVDNLRSNLSAMRAKVDDGWGGPQALERLSQAQDSINSVIEKAATPKQDWQAVRTEVIEAHLVLRPTQSLIDEEIAKYEGIKRSLEALTEELNRCRDNSYSRCVGGVLYGNGIYCQTARASKSLEGVLEILQRRDYSVVEQRLAETKEELKRANLESWWLSLQMMSLSEDQSARQYSATEGYSDGGFDAWVQSKMNGATGFYDAPVANGAQPSNRLRLHQEIVDPPSLRDYECQS